MGAVHGFVIQAGSAWKIAAEKNVLDEKPMELMLPGEGGSSSSAAPRLREGWQKCFQELLSSVPKPKLPFPPCMNHTDVKSFVFPECSLLGDSLSCSPACVNLKLFSDVFQ